MAKKKEVAPEEEKVVALPPKPRKRTGKIEFTIQSADGIETEEGLSYIGIRQHPGHLDEKRWMDYLDQVASFIPAFQDQYDGNITITLCVRYESMKQSDELNEFFTHSFSHVFKRENNGKLVEAMYCQLVMPLMGEIHKQNTVS